MARGNTILLNGTDPKGRMCEGVIAASITPKPGTIMQMDPTVALKGGVHTFKLYSRGADGNNPAGPHYVLLEDSYQGRDVDTAFAAGERCRLYPPLPGDELNLIILNITGTGDDHTLGEILMVDNETAKLIVTTGSPEREVAMLLEAITDPTADTLAWCVWAG